MAKEVIKFWAPWCSPCSTYAPTFKKVKQDLSQSIVFTEINVDEDLEGLTAQYRVKGIPCTVVINGGVEVSRQAGALSEEQLRELILTN